MLICSKHKYIDLFVGGEPDPGKQPVRARHQVRLIFNINNIFLDFISSINVF